MQYLQLIDHTLLATDSYLDVKALFSPGALLLL